MTKLQFATTNEVATKVWKKTLLSISVNEVATKSHLNSKQRTFYYYSAIGLVRFSNLIEFIDFCSLSWLSYLYSFALYTSSVLGFFNKIIIYQKKKKKTTLFCAHLSQQHIFINSYNYFFFNIFCVCVCVWECERERERRRGAGAFFLSLTPCHWNSNR